MIYPIRAPMALFLPVGSLWKDWLQLKPACGRRSNFAHAQRVDAVGWQRKDWVQKRCPLTHCQDLALGDLSRSAYIHTFDVAIKIKQNDAKEISVYLKCSSHVHIPNVARIGNVSPCHSLLKDYHVEIAVLN